MNTITFAIGLSALKRRGKGFTRYFSDQPRGRATALRAAHSFQDKLVSQLPRPTEIKRKYVRNMTGVIGVAGAKGMHSTREVAGALRGVMA